MGMGFAPTWLCQVRPPLLRLLHKTTLTTGRNCDKISKSYLAKYYRERVSLCSTDLRNSILNYANKNLLFVGTTDSTKLEQVRIGCNICRQFIRCLLEVVKCELQYKQNVRVSI